MAHYELKTNSACNHDTLFVTEHAIYGSSRLGVDNRRAILYNGANVSADTTTYTYRNLGFKSYELSNHLGNVLVTISDKKIPKRLTGGIGAIDYFNPDINTISDYYAFGSPMPTRSWSDPNAKYKYGFNGKEKDNEIAVYGGDYDFGARIYDGRLGRWLSLDPLMAKYANWSPFNFCTNDPLYFIDPSGRDILPTIYTTTYTGPEVPNCLGELAEVYCSADLIFNKSTQTYDFQITLETRFSKGFKAIMARNPGLDDYPTKHEQEHKDRFNILLYKKFTISKTQFGTTNDIEGTLDQVMNTIFNEKFKARFDDLESWKTNELAQLDIEYQAAITAAGDDVDKQSKAMSDFDERSSQINKKYKTDIKLLKDERISVENELLDLWNKAGDEANEHEGLDGVNAQSEKKMSFGAREFSTGKMKAENQHYEVMENCP